jgi:hypothetical protein
MKIDKKYIKAFTQEKSDQLQETGYKYLYESNGIFYFEDNKSLSKNFSNTDILSGTKFTTWIPI